MLLFSGLSGIGAPLRAAAAADGVIHPRSVFEIDPPAAAARNAELTEALSQAAIAFEEARFEEAGVQLSRALEIEPSLESAVAPLVTACETNRELQRQARRELPTEPAEFQSFLRRSYAALDELVRGGHHEQAVASAEAIWIVAGSYKDVIDIYMMSLAWVSGEAPEAPAPGSPAAESPAPVADQAAPAALSAPANEAVLAEADQVDLDSQENARELRANELRRRIQELDALASAALRNNEFDSAERSWREVLSHDGANKNALKGLDQVEKQRTAYNRRQREERIERLNATGEELLAVGKYDEAREQFESALALEPANRKAEKGLREAAVLRQADMDRAVAARVENTLAKARAYLENDELAFARASVDQALSLDPSNAEAARVLNMIASRQAVSTGLQPIDALEADRAAGASPAFDLAQADAMDSTITDSATSAGAAMGDTMSAAADTMPSLPMSDEARRIELDRLDREGRTLYHRGDLEGARKAWDSMIALDPADLRATTFLAETQAEFERHQADLAARAEAVTRSRQREELLSSPVTIATDRPTPLSEFMRLLSFATPTEIEYYISTGAEADVFLNFRDRPLRQVLDTVLLPIGMTWTMDERNLITISPDFKTRVFNLSRDQLNKLRSLLELGELQRIIWGQSEPPAKGLEMTIDERQGVFVVTGSRKHIQMIDDFIATLETAEAPELEIRIYKIREEDGPKIKALINALIATDSQTPFGPERKIFVDGSDLIIHDTPENIVKIEELLLNEQFIRELREENLEIANFSLVPRNIDSPQGTQQLIGFTTRVVEAIQVFLYSKDGLREAEKEGRRLWFDRYAFQLTIVDTPTRIEAVGRFLESLPELRQNRLQKIFFLDYAVADDLAANLAVVLGLDPTASGGVAGGSEVTKRMRRGDEIEFRDLRMRLIRVEENHENDRNDDEVELLLDTGIQSSNINLRELDRTIFENYELTAEEVTPSAAQRNNSGDGGSRNQGEGRATITIRYIPPEEISPTAQTAALPAAEPEPDTGLDITPFDPLNALIVQYDNPADLVQVEDLVRQLDQPLRQVSVETKFVQVNETRAREVSADFDLSGLANDTNFDTDIWKLGSRFAQTQDEQRDTFEPLIENPLAANLLRGTTVLDFALGNVPGLSFQLRLLESEGIINITSGPKVTMADGIVGRFEMDKIGPPGDQNQQGGEGGDGGSSTSIPNLGGSGGSGGGSGGSSGGSGSGSGSNEGELIGTGSSFENTVASVALQVQPEITSAKSIIMQIQAEILDYESNLGRNVALGGGGQGEDTVFVPPSQIDPNPEESLLNATGGTSPFATYIITDGTLWRNRKFIDTTARTHDGGTIILGGWTGERAQDLTSGVPVLRNMPYFGKLFFSRSQRSVDRVTLLIFMTANLVD